MGARGPLPKGALTSGDGAGGEPVEIEPPKYLDKEQAAEFRRAVGWVIARGVPLAPEDEAIIEIYARARVEFRKASKVLEKEGATLTGERGGAYLHPIAGHVAGQRKAIIEAASKLGFSPADRARLVAPKAEESNPLLDKIKQRNGGRG